MKDPVKKDLLKELEKTDAFKIAFLQGSIKLAITLLENGKQDVALQGLKAALQAVNS